MSDLQKLLEGAHFSVSTPENDDERASRLRREEWEEKVRHGKEIATLLFTLAVTSTVLFLCYGAVQSGTEEEKKWAMSIFAGVTGSLVGWIVGKRA